jgi:oxygen-independent coproporphyrinogen-3 oxidase
VRAVGFERVCLDLMLGLPEQSLEGFLDSVRRAIDWGAEIISIYPMRFYGRPRWLGAKPDQRESVLDLRTQLIGRIAADSLLRAAGFESFEATYWHRRDSRHGYHSEYIEGSMKGGNWLGVGHKAQSNLYPHQYSNYAHLGRYAEAVGAGRLPIAEGAIFEPRQRLGKQLVSMLQLPGGIDWDAVESSFEPDVVAPFARLLGRFEDAGLLERRDALRWTGRGFFFIDEMMKAIYELALA